jgi:predicted cytidylate kinase
MLRICISGLSSSGKTTIGEALAKDLGIMHITKYKLESFKKHESEIKKLVIQTADKKYADAFDKEVAALAGKHNCVVTTWLGPWLVKDATMRIWLSASVEERAKRHAGDMGISVDKAKAYIREKDELTVNAFKEIYSIDVKDHAFFDMMINTERLNLDESVSIISMLAVGKENLRFR